MASPTRDDNTSLNQSNTVIITVAVALVILAGIGAVYLLIPNGQTPTPEGIIASSPTQDWPAPPPTFGATLLRLYVNHWGEVSTFPHHPVVKD